MKQWNSLLTRSKKDQPTIFAILCLLFAVVASSCALTSGSQGDVDRQLQKLLDQAGVGPLEIDIHPSPEKIALGEMLFWDPELSGNRDTACVTCHHPQFGSGDGLSLPVGTGGRGVGSGRQLGEDREFVGRNATPIYNLGFSQWHTMFWDGRVSGNAETGYVNPASDDLPPDLENVIAAQAMFPVTSRDEMRGDRGDLDILGERNELAWIRDMYPEQVWEALMVRLLDIPEYVALFQAAYPELDPADLGFQHAANAIAAYEMVTYTFLDSPWDRYLQGNESTLSEEAKRGAVIFYGEGGCANCHAGDLMTDQEFYNLAVPHVGPGKGREGPLDYGRARETGSDCDLYAFRTPPLRNVALTGPWMHNGAYASLEEAVRHQLDPLTALQGYDVNQLAPELRESALRDPGVTRAALDCPEVHTEVVELTQAEFEDLIAFLNALTSPAALDLSHLIPARVPSGLEVGGR